MHALDLPGVPDLELHAVRGHIAVRRALLRQDVGLSHDELPLDVVLCLFGCPLVYGLARLLVRDFQPAAYDFLASCDFRLGNLDLRGVVVHAHDVVLLQVQVVPVKQGCECLAVFSLDELEGDLFCRHIAVRRLFFRQYISGVT